MKSLLIFSILLLNLSFGQRTFRSGSIPNLKKGITYIETNENNKVFYELKGNVKSVFINENYTLKYKKKDSSYSKTINNQQEVFFNSLGNLTHKYLFDINNDKYLNIENIYLKDSILILQKNKYKYLQLNRKKNLYQESNNFHHIENKYTYNKVDQLLLHTIKSSFQDTFFISERNTYNKKGLLILQESLNNHFYVEEFDAHTCHGDGSSRRSYVREFLYNNKKQLLSKKTKSFYNNTNGIDSFLNSINKYDRKGNRIKTDIYNIKKGDKKLISTTHYKFNDKNQEIEYYNKDYKINRVYGQFFEHDFDSTGFLKRKIIGQINNPLKTKTLLKSTYLIYEYSTDGSFKVLHFNGNNLEYTSFYDTQQNFITQDKKFINSFIDCKYTYDKNNNWTKCIVTHEGSQKVFTRKIEYY